MSKQIEALKKALEWIEAQIEPRMLGALEAITAIREALAEQPAQQPHCDDCGGFDPKCPLAQPCTYPNCPYPCPDLPDCRDAEKPVGWFESPHGIKEGA